MTDRVLLNATEAELSAYYSAMSFDIGEIPAKAEAIYTEGASSSYMMKARLLALFCRECTPHLFRTLPFFSR